MANTSESISSTTHGDDVLGGSGENVLAKHAAFFDRNKDGVIYPWETFQGFRAIGAGLLLSFVAAIVINFGLSRKTRPVPYSGSTGPDGYTSCSSRKAGQPMRLCTRITLSFSFHPWC